MELKADKTAIEKLIERINEVHEVAMQAQAKAEKKNESSDEEEVVGENGEFDPGSPDSVKKKKKKKGEPDSEEERQREELRRQ